MLNYVIMRKKSSKCEESHNFFLFYEILRLKPKYDLLYKKELAFTLAEVLITIGIIGIVAAMTIPTLIFKNQKFTDSQLRLSVK